MEQQKYLRPIEEREIVSGESLVAAPDALTKQLRAAGNTSGQSISPGELQLLVERGVDPIRMHTELPQYANGDRSRNINLLTAMLAIGNAPCLQWLMRRYDLSKFVFTGELGKRISKELITKNSASMVASLVEAGLYGDRVLPALQSAGKATFERAVGGGSVSEDYATAKMNAPQLAFVEAMRRTGQLEHPGSVFAKLLSSQNALLSMRMVRHFAQACGGVQATDFSAETSRRVIERLLLGLTEAKDRPQALAQLIEWGFDRYPVEADSRHFTSTAKIYAGAASLGVPLLEFLHAAQFDLEDADDKGKTPLIHAVEKSDLPAVRWMVEHGARLDARDEKGETVMHYAVRHARLAVIDYLFAVGAPTSARNRQGRTPLGVYDNTGQGSDYLSLLMGRSIPMGRNLAMLAVYDGNDEKLEEAIKAGDDVNLLDDVGGGIAQRITAHAIANPRIWELLGQAGYKFDEAKVLWGHGKDGKPDEYIPLLHRYCIKSDKPKVSADLVRMMVRAGANPDVLDATGQTALHRAIKEQNVEVVKVLLEEGADHTIRLGRTTTMQMARASEEIKKLLAQYRIEGAVANAMKGGEEPLGDLEHGSLSNPAPL